MQETADARAQWTIKNFRVKVRESAVSAAARAGETVADWVERAVENEVSRERGTAVIPPGKPEHTAESPAMPAAVVSAADVAALIQGIAALGAVDGVPKRIRASAHAAADAKLREARGLPPKAGKPGIPILGKPGNLISG